MDSRSLIRDLAARVADRAASSGNRRVRENWRAHNSLRAAYPPVVCRIYPPAAFEITGPPVSTDPFERWIEERLRVLNLKIDLGDDETFEPWIDLPAVFLDTGPLFGVAPDYESARHPGSWRYRPVLTRMEDIERLRPPSVAVDTEASARRKERAEHLLNGILGVRVRTARLDYISLGYHAASLRGYEGLLYDFLDRPEFVHALMAKLRDCVREGFLAQERQGLLQYNHGALHSSRSGYVDDLPRPGSDGSAVRLVDLWGHSDAQELTVASPAMIGEFLFPYELPLMSLFGLMKYGCCESHHGKWHLCRQIPNLRVLSVSPWTSLREAVQEMGPRVVYNWRVNVSRVVRGASAQAMRQEIRDGLDAAEGHSIEVVLQDVETLYGQKDLLATWVRIAREETARCRVLP